MDPLLQSQLVPGRDGQLQEVRVFSNQSTQKAVADALESIPEGRRSAILAVDVPEAGGVQAVVAARLDKHWSIGLVGEYHGSRRVSGGARVAFSW
jgi:hypothetical protein